MENQRRERINKIIKSIKNLRFFWYDDMRRERERSLAFIALFAVCCCWFDAFKYAMYDFQCASMLHFLLLHCKTNMLWPRLFCLLSFSPSFWLIRSLARLLAVVFFHHTCVTRIALPEFFSGFHLFFWLVWFAITNISEIESISINRSHRFQINNSGDIHMPFFWFMHIAQTAFLSLLTRYAVVCACVFSPDSFLLRG